MTEQNQKQLGKILLTIADQLRGVMGAHDFRHYMLSFLIIHSGCSFDDFLKEEGIFEEVQAKALKRVVAEQIEDGMQTAKLTKVAMANKMATSRSQLDRILDPNNLSVQLDTLIRAARAVGKVVEIKIKRPRKTAEA
jgi:antitoxin HicB